MNHPSPYEPTAERADDANDVAARIDAVLVGYQRGQADASKPEPGQ